MEPDFLAAKIRAGESFLLASDGQYLGKLTLNSYDPESIFNVYGPYGSRYSSTSIFNVYGNYGSAYSALSPFNPYTSTPPAIYVRGQFVGFLTKNNYLGTNVIDPRQLTFWMQSMSLNY